MFLLVQFRGPHIFVWIKNKCEFAEIIYLGLFIFCLYIYGSFNDVSSRYYIATKLPTKRLSESVFTTRCLFLYVFA